MHIGVRVAGGLFAALFVYAALVQLNDVDVWSWLSLYVVAAALTGLLVFRRRAPRAMLGLGGVAWAWGAALVPALLAEQQTWSSALSFPEQIWGSELAREVLGLGIVGVTMGVLWYVSRPRREIP